jgi:hypothetical protein
MEQNEESDDDKSGNWVISKWLIEVQVLAGIVQVRRDHVGAVGTLKARIAPLCA